MRFFNLTMLIMKREIKFRVWDKLDKEMTLFDSIRILPHEKNFYQLFEEDRYIWMQYTGLKDKKGKEVYEGDYVLVKEDDGFWYGRGFVKFYKGGFQVNSMQLQNVYAENLTLEVVGNIHENPELLK